MNLRITTVAAALLALAACESTGTEAACAAPVRAPLEAAVTDVEARLAGDCAFHFDRYFEDLLTIAEANPAPGNRMLFSDFLLRQHERGLLGRRQAEERYNRYFGVKFVALTGDYNTCSQTCPVREETLARMREELRDKERGMLRAADDRSGFYRADALLKEAELVLEATCRACAAEAEG